MTAFSLDTITPTYWATGSGFKERGIDPLGINGSSQIIVDKLLPGVTTQTPRIRYYGLYCYLIHVYFKHKSTEEVISKDQHTYIKRGEIITLFIMNQLQRGFTDIPGRDFYDDTIATIGKDGYFLFESRFDYKRGTGDNFQFYVNSLQLLNCVQRHAYGYIELSPKGKALALGYENSISNVQRELFVKIITGDGFYISDIIKLGDYSFSNIPVQSQEWLAYIDTFIGPDKSTPTYRGISILEFLRIIDSDKKFNSINSEFTLPSFYSQNIEDVLINENHPSVGWYLYYLQSLLHRGMEYIFTSMLYYMNENFYHKEEFVNMLIEKFKVYENNHSITVSDYIDNHISVSIEEIYYEVTKEFKRSNYDLVIGHSLRMILLSYKLIIQNYQSFNTYLKSNKLVNRRGDMHNVKYLFSKYLYKNTIDFFKFICTKIIKDHQQVGFERMEKGKTTHKFTIEHNYLFYHFKSNPGFVGTRLNNVFKFLVDLKLVSTDGPSLTDDGRAVLNSYSK